MRQSDIIRMVKAFQTPQRWSQHCEARTRRGQPCHYDDPDAWALSLDGLYFLTMGPIRTMPFIVAFVVGMRIAEVDKLRTKPDPPCAALTALINFNDTSNFAEIRHRLLRLEPCR